MMLFIDTPHKEFYEGRAAAYEGDAGLDLFFPKDVIIPSKSTMLIDFEVKCQMNGEDRKPVSYYLYPRSSIYKTPLRMANSVGIIDAMYRHSIKAAVDNTSEQDYTILRGTRLFQICAPTLSSFRVQLCDLQDSSRGEGFGSSGV